MGRTKADIKADIVSVKKTAKDRGETVSSMEPLLIGEGSRHRPGLTDLALELAQRSAGFRRSLPASLLASLADLVRSMNCYYSNLIEGHDTHPIDIERALKDDYSEDARKRDLQLEALWPPRQDRNHTGSGASASPLRLDPPVSRWQRPRRSPGVARNAA